MVLRGIFRDFFSEKTIASLVVSIPPLYWWVVPYLLSEEMVMPTAAFSLKPGEHRMFRALFFFLGLIIFVLAALL